MIVRATILQKQQRGRSLDRGEFDFLQLPNKGDHIQILNSSRKIDLLCVDYVQYTPCPAQASEWPTSSFAHIICDYLGES